MRKIAIFGTGGFALEVADICDSLSVANIILLANSETHEKTVAGLEVCHENRIDELKQAGCQFAIGVANPEIRKKIVMQYPDLDYPALIHPSATFGRLQKEAANSSRGLILAAGVRMMNSIDIGAFVAVSLNATIGHDCVIGDYVSIMPGVNISGNVILDECCYIGSGAVVLQGDSRKKLRLEQRVTVGAGSVVTKSVSSGLTVYGVPAHPKRI